MIHIAIINSSTGKRNIATETKQDEIITLLIDNKKLIVDDITTTDVTYVGKATIGTAEDAALWQIKKIDETTGISKILWADGDTNYDNIWDNRAITIVYS